MDANIKIHIRVNFASIIKPTPIARKNAGTIKKPNKSGSSSDVNNSDSGKRIFSINLPQCKPKTIEVPVFINDIRVTGLIDTGSAENYV